jgi:hypothetical protein
MFNLAFIWLLKILYNGIFREGEGRDLTHGKALNASLDHEETLSLI